jgi:hypothetical protein
MSYDSLSSVSQNVLYCYQQLTGEERRIPFIFDGFHFCHSRVIGRIKGLKIGETPPKSWLLSSLQFPKGSPSLHN